MMASDDVERRRRFLKQAVGSIGLTLGAGTIASIVSACETTERLPTTPAGRTVVVDLAGIPALAAPGGITVLLVAGLNNDRPVFISRISDTDAAVFDTTCTHLRCPVGAPIAAGANCVCPCHGAEYSPVNGAVLVQPSSGVATDLIAYTSVLNPNTMKLTITT